MRIFVLDDDPAILKLVANVLRSSGHEPVLATDAAEFDALDEKPDAAIVDWHLGDQTCEAVVAELRAKHVGLPVLIITADSDLDLIQRALSLGARGWWLKTTGVENLRRQLGDFLNQTQRAAG